MDEEAKQILKDLKIPIDVINLLEKLGFKSVDDLVELDEEKIMDIVECIRDGSVEDYFGLDFDQKSTRTKFLGTYSGDLREFKFMKFVVARMKQISTKAREKSKIKRAIRLCRIVGIMTMVLLIMWFINRQFSVFCFVRLLLIRLHSLLCTCISEEETGRSSICDQD